MPIPYVTFRSGDPRLRIPYICIRLFQIFSGKLLKKGRKACGKLRHYGVRNFLGEQLINSYVLMYESCDVKVKERSSG